MRGETKKIYAIIKVQNISIHSPHAGRDKTGDFGGRGISIFQSTLPMRGETTARRYLRASASLISIHSPHAGRDIELETADRNIESFQSTLPMRGETSSRGIVYKFLLISIHSPHAGRDRLKKMRVYDAAISIHSPHAGRDANLLTLTSFSFAFQSTLPMRGETIGYYWYLL